MKRIGKQKISSLNPTNTQKKKKNNFEQQPFTVPTHQAPVTDQKTDLSGYRQPQPGATIANVMRSIEAGTANKPAFKKQGNDIPAPPRQNYQPIINPIRQLTAPRQDSLGKRQVVQPKLTIGRPNDKYEQEADRVAAQVVRQINHPAPKSMAQGGMVQGKEEESGLRMKPMPTISEIEAMPEEGEMRKKPMVQRREAIGGGEASAELSGEINRARGGGKPLDPGLQLAMGQAMGADLRGVRVHTDERADRLNRSLSSRAFTTGQDLFFKKGEYQPGRGRGLGLIAHELTHTIQQRKRPKIQKAIEIKMIGPYGERKIPVLETDDAIDLLEDNGVDYLWGYEEVEEELSRLIQSEQVHEFVGENHLVEYLMSLVTRGNEEEFTEEEKEEQGTFSFSQWARMTEEAARWDRRITSGSIADCICVIVFREKDLESGEYEEIYGRHMSGGLIEDQFVDVIRRSALRKNDLVKIVSGTKWSHQGQTYKEIKELLSRMGIPEKIVQLRSGEGSYTYNRYGEELK